jgi:hypothetical protein
MSHVTFYSEVITDSSMQVLFSRGPDQTSLLSTVPVTVPTGYHCSYFLFST